jgi:hypothetical protein
MPCPVALALPAVNKRIKEGGSELQHSLRNESARAPTYDALAYLCTQILNVTAGEGTVGESTVASALQRRWSLLYACGTDSLSGLDSSKFSNVLSCWVSEYASWLKIGILNSISPSL